MFWKRGDHIRYGANVGTIAIMREDMIIVEIVCQQGLRSIARRVGWPPPLLERARVWYADQRYTIWDMSHIAPHLIDSISR